MKMLDDGLLVSRLMTRDPVTIAQDAPIAAAERLMERHRVSGLPVIDEEGALVGVISQSDLIRAHATDALWSRWPGLAVRHLMTSPALTVEASAPLTEAAERMEQFHVHRLVVVDADTERPVGVLSTLDLVRALLPDPGPEEAR